MSLPTLSLPRLVVLGCGTLGTLVARAHVAAGGACLGFTETEARHAELRRLGVVPHRGPPDLHLRAGDRLLLALPGSERQLEALTALAPLPPPARTVLISSVGYYGQPIGRVTEETPPGADARSQLIAQTEHVFRAWAGDAGVILRTAGLYQRGRGPLSALKRTGGAPFGPPDRTLSLIHYEDAAAATYRALLHPTPEAVYLNVVPPSPTRFDFYLAACVVLSLPDPAFDAPLKLPPAVYDNSRLRRDVLPEPTHPRWQESLLP